MEIENSIELIATSDGLVWFYDEETQTFTLTEFTLIEED